MEGDLHNLVPSVGAINALRSNYSFGDAIGEDKELCKNGLQLEGRKISPPNHRKGDVARIYFYMNEQYPGKGIISNKNQKLFEAWDKIDPVSQEECTLHQKKALIQGSVNKFVQRGCAK